MAPQFRDGTWGKSSTLPAWRLCPADRVPVVFIVPDNRYAIRNWEEYGFQAGTGSAPIAPAGRTMEDQDRPALGVRQGGRAS